MATGTRERGGEFGQVLVELQRKSQELVAVILEQRADRTKAMRTLRRAHLQFGDDEIEQGTTIDVRQRGDGENIGAQPACQHGNIVGQQDRFGLLGGGGGGRAA
jgi:hypothetical protein